jgi:hypothetical protein
MMVAASTAALARKVVGVLRVMSSLRLECIDSRSDGQWSNHATRSPQPENLVVAGVSTDGGGGMVGVAWSPRGRRTRSTAGASSAGH